jgi:hypothetical protein
MLTISAKMVLLLFLMFFCLILSLGVFLRSLMTRAEAEGTTSKNLCKCHNVPLPSTIIKLQKKKKVLPQFGPVCSEKSVPLKPLCLSSYHLPQQHHYEPFLETDPRDPSWQPRQTWHLSPDENLCYPLRESQQNRTSITQSTDFGNTWIRFSYIFLLSSSFLLPDVTSQINYPPTFMSESLLGESKLHGP